MTSLPIRLSTNSMTFIPSLTFTELWVVSMEHLATGVASQQGTLTLPDTWFRPPFWDLLMLQLLRPNSSNLPCLYSTFHLEYPLVLSRFYLLHSLEINLGDLVPSTEVWTRSSCCPHCLVSQSIMFYQKYLQGSRTAKCKVYCLFPIICQIVGVEGV